MTVLEAIILGIIQGATEFLPISSSGHTILLPSLFNMSNPGLNVIAITHLGTLLAIVVYFRSDLWTIATAMVAGVGSRQPLAVADSRLGWYIVLGSVPAGTAGLLLEEFFEQVFGRPLFAAIFLLFTAGLLVLGERLRTGQQRLDTINGLDALAIGFFQMLALFPGISRSGSTIAGGLGRGLTREGAARFSFLLGVPAILGAGLLALLDIGPAELLRQWPAFLAAFLAAAIVGYACIHLLLTWLQQHTFYPFAAYCAALGSVYLLLAALGVV